MCFLIPKVAWAAHEEETDVNGTVTKIALNEACEQCWLICNDYLHLQWPTFIGEIKIAGSRTQILYQVVFANWLRRKVGHTGPHEEEDLVLQLGKIVEIDEAYEVREESEVAKAIGRVKLTKALADTLGVVSMPQEFGLEGLVAFKHPVLPPKTLHIRQTFAILSDNTVLKPTEIMYSEHLRDEWKHQAQDYKALTDSKGLCTSELRLTFKEWVEANKPSSAADNASRAPSSSAPPGSGIVRQVVGVAATQISAQDAAFVSGSAPSEAKSPSALTKQKSFESFSLGDRSRMSDKAMSPAKLASDVASNAGSDDIADLGSLADVGGGNYFVFQDSINFRYLFLSFRSCCFKKCYFQDSISFIFKCFRSCFS